MSDEQNQPISPANDQNPLNAEGSQAQAAHGEVPAEIVYDSEGDRASAHVSVTADTEAAPTSQSSTTDYDLNPADVPKEGMHVRNQPPTSFSTAP
jgi:hypothetical protein